MLGDGVDSLAFAVRGIAEPGVELVAREYLVHIIAFQGFVRGDGESGPDHGVGIDRGNEEGRFLSRNVVGEVGVGERTAT